MDSNCVAVFSDHVSERVKQQILEAARTRWPSIRLSRDESHFQHHAHFASENACNPLLSGDEANKHSEILANAPEWSRQFPQVTFAVVEIDDSKYGGRETKGYVCCNGTTTYTLHPNNYDQPYHLLDKVGVDYRHFDPLSPRLFCCLTDIISDALADCDSLRAYLTFMQGHLTASEKDFEARTRERKDDYFYEGWTDDVEDPIGELGAVDHIVNQEREWYQDTLAQELLRSVFVTTFALLERRLMECCKYLDKRHGSGQDGTTLDVTKQSGGLQEQERYLSSLMTTSYFETSLVWSTINDYRKIRNQIIHVGDVIDLETINIQPLDMESKSKEAKSPEERKKKRLEKRREEQYKFIEMIGKRTDVRIEDGAIKLLPTICEVFLDEVKQLFTELSPLLPKV